jgi:hypothetical protein
MGWLWRLWESHVHEKVSDNEVSDEGVDIPEEKFVDMVHCYYYLLYRPNLVKYFHDLRLEMFVYG